jgi:hypothetical protein
MAPRGVAVDFHRAVRLHAPDQLARNVEWRYAGNRFEGVGFGTLESLDRHFARRAVDSRTEEAEGNPHCIHSGSACYRQTGHRDSLAAWVQGAMRESRPRAGSAEHSGTCFRLTRVRDTCEVAHTFSIIGLAIISLHVALLIRVSLQRERIVPFGTSGLTV